MQTKPACILNFVHILLNSYITLHSEPRVTRKLLSFLIFDYKLNIWPFPLNEICLFDWFLSIATGFQQFVRNQNFVKMLSQKIYRRNIKFALKRFLQRTIPHIRSKKQEKTPQLNQKGWMQNTQWTLKKEQESGIHS